MSCLILIFSYQIALSQTLKYQGYKGHVNSVTTYNYTYINNSEGLQKKVLHDIAVEQYDKNGIQTTGKVYHFENNKLQDSAIVKYLLKRNIIELNLGSKFKRQYILNDKGNILEETEQDESGHIYLTRHYLYNNEGNIIEVTGTSASSHSFKDTIIYKYDGNNNIIEAKGSSKSLLYDDFDKNGNWLKATLPLKGLNTIVNIRKITYY